MKTKKLSMSELARAINERVSLNLREKNNIENMKHINLTNEIYTEPKQDKYEWVWWVALIIPMLYFIGHIIWAIIR